MIKQRHLCAAVLTFLCLWYCSKTGESQAYAYTESRLAYLTVKLKLDQTQVDRIRAILTEENGDITKLRSTNVDDPRDMWRGLRERQDETNTQIESVLTDKQKETYQGLRALGINDNNFIELQAKLALTVDQSDSVAKILSGMRGVRGSMRGAGDPAGPPGNRENRMMDMRAMREKSDAAIRAVLDDNQKELYDKLQEERMEEMRRRFESRGSMWE